MEFLETHHSLIIAIIWAIGVTALVAAAFSGPYKRMHAENVCEDELFRFLAGSFIAGFGFSFGIIAIVGSFRSRDDWLSELLAGATITTLFGLFGLIYVGQLRPRHFRRSRNRRGAEQIAISPEDFSDERKAHEFVWSHLPQVERDHKWNEQQAAKRNAAPDPFDHEA